jgi:hypothetical protein
VSVQLSAGHNSCIYSCKLKYVLDHIGFEVLTAVVMKSCIFWDVTPCSPSEARIKQRALVALLTDCFMLLSCLAYSGTMNMEATCSSKTSVDFHQITQGYIPEDRTLHYWASFSFLYIRFQTSTLRLHWSLISQEVRLFWWGVRPLKDLFRQKPKYKNAGTHLYP